MLDFLISWVEQIIIALVLILILEMILPEESTYRKYIKTVFGVFMIFCMINPILSHGIEKISIGKIDYKNIDYSNAINNEKIIEAEFKNRFKESIENFLKNNGYELTNIEQDIEYYDNAIQINRLKLAIKQVDKSNNIDIEVLKEKFVKFYDIEISKIEILESEI